MAHTNLVELVPNAGWDERILVCRNGRLVQTFIIISQHFVFLVDTVINPHTAQQMMAIAEPHLPGRSLLIINTHADYDHAWGNQLFAGPAAPYPAPIIGRRAVAEQFASPEVLAYLAELQQKEPAIFGHVRLTPPTLLFDNELEINGGDLTLKLFAAPGHTADHTAIYIPEINTLLAGDGAEFPYPAARVPAGLPQMRQSLANMAALQPQNALYCHAPVTIGPQLLHDNMAYFDQMESRCRAALAQGVPAALPPDLDLIALVGCPIDEMLPAGDPWQTLHPYYRTAGHADQIRTMLTWLQRANDQPSQGQNNK